MNITVEYVDICLFFEFVLFKFGDGNWWLAEAWIVFHNIKFSVHCSWTQNWTHVVLR